MRRSLKILLARAIVLDAPASSDEMITGGADTWKFTLGGIVSRIDSGIGIDGTTNNGTVIDLDGGPGNKEAASVLLGAKWRLADNHRLGGLFFRTSKHRALSFN